jgi:hypothetical protein
MATRKQIEANRLNARKSTGPRSAEGRGVSSQNALKTGIDAQSIIIRGEDSADLEALTAEYLERLRPRTPEQRHYLDSLIRDSWQLRRLAKADAQIWDRAMNRAYQLDEEAPLGHAFEIEDRTFIRLQRRIDSTHRSYKAALHELQRLQKEQETGSAGGLATGDRGAGASVCQPEPAELPESPAQVAQTKPGSPQIGFVPSLSQIGFVPAKPLQQNPCEPSRHPQGAGLLAPGFRLHSL